MVRRVFWFTVGAGAAVFVVVKVRGVLQQATPQAIGQRVTGSAVGIGATVRDFSDRVRAAMAERETELRDALGLND
jgi:NADH:ubiquinone oxidoreductase subunit D